MDIEGIRNIDIVSYLSKCGIHPKRTTGKYAMYLSPLSEETEPSFSVNLAKNRFHCYSTGASGSVVDYVMAKEHLDFASAVDFLKGDNITEIKEYTPPKKKADGVKIHSVEKLTDKELLDYACGVRRIDEEVVSRYLNEITISFPYSKKDDTRTYKMIGFKSDLGGYECRSSWMRVCAGSKSYTTIKGQSKDKCIVIEGFFDVLTYFTYYDTLVPEYTIYCLNGAGQFDALNVFIGDTPVLYYGDNDKNGDIIASKITNLRDMRSIYPFYKDMNAWWVDN